MAPAQFPFVPDGRAKQRVYLILAYAKNEKDTLSGREKQQMRKLTAILKAEP